MREAVLDTDENLGVLDGVVVEEWEDENGEVRLDAIDGGTWMIRVCPICMSSSTSSHPGS